MTDVKHAFQRGILKLMIAAMPVVGADGIASAAPTKSQPKAKTTQKLSTIKAMDYSRVEIKDKQSLIRLFNKSLPIIFPELVLEEVPMANAYDDYGRFRGKKNTVGVGSMHSPLKTDDYKNPGVTWYAVRRNPKSLQGKKYSYSDMAKLAIGWAYRTKIQNINTGTIVSQKSVLDRMFPLLKGAQLRPNEFAALFCACYNNENNITRLCPYIKKHWNNPLACSQKIMFWDAEANSNAGTRDRCLFESLVYINYNNFCASMLNMRVCPSSRASCINLKLPRREYKRLSDFNAYSDHCKNKYLSVVYKNGFSVQTTVRGLDGLLNGQLDIVSNDAYDKLQSEYDKAILIYESGDYKLALAKFLAIQVKGARGASILNDIAITYFNLKEYKDCIKYCQQVLKTGDKQEYAKAVYTAGRAYESLGDYAKALNNYTKAKQYLDAYGIADPADINYSKIYTSARNRVLAKVKQTKTHNK